MQYIISLILFILSTSAFATDLEDFQERCETYGAKPGSTIFFICIRDLDESNKKNKAYEDLSKKCDEVPRQKIIAQTMAASDSPWDASIGRRNGIAAANEYPTKCKNAAYRRIFGTK